MMRTAVFWSDGDLGQCFGKLVPATRRAGRVDVPAGYSGLLKGGDGGGIFAMEPVVM